MRPKKTFGNINFPGVIRVQFDLKDVKVQNNVIFEILDPINL